MIEGTPMEGFPETAWINSWAEADPFADTLGLSGHVKDFSPLTSFPNLRHLWVRAASQEQLALIGNLTRLERLTVGWLRSVKDFGPLSRLANLQTLCLEGSMKGISLEPLGRLTNLRRLFLRALMSTAINGGKAACESFGPLANLVDLEYLQLFFIRPLDKDMSPLTKLKSLGILDIPNSFPLEDMAMLAAALPDTKGVFQISHETLSPDKSFLCKRCGGDVHVRLIGRVRSRRMLPCPVCDAQTISRHAAEYEELRERFARELG